MVSRDDRRAQLEQLAVTNSIAVVRLYQTVTRTQGTPPPSGTLTSQLIDEILKHEYPGEAQPSPS